MIEDILALQDRITAHVEKRNLNKQAYALANIFMKERVASNGKYCPQKACQPHSTYYLGWRLL